MQYALKMLRRVHKKNVGTTIIYGANGTSSLVGGSREGVANPCGRGKALLISSCVYTSISIEGESLSPLRPLCKGTSPLDPIKVQLFWMQLSIIHLHCLKSTALGQRGELANPMDT